MIISNKSIAMTLKKRQKVDSELKEFKLEEHLFKEQLDFVTSKAANKVAVCSRRAGKTTACAADLVHTAINNPSTVSLYVTLSRNNAKKIIWKEIKDLNRTYKLKGELNLSELSVTFPNGSMIYLSGAKDTTEIEKFRGLALKLVYIDECQSFRQYIKDLIDDVLAPALMDHSGTLNIIGTPSAIPTGFFHDAYATAPGWEKHHWTFWDNPFITQKSKLTHKQMLDRELNRRGVTADDPSILREWFGKFTLDSDSLLVHYKPQLNNYAQLPEVSVNVKYEYVMGIDLGFDDSDAIAIMAWNDTSPTTYLVEELVVPQQGITELVNQVESLRKKYDVSKIVIDQGGLGKKIAEEMRRRHAIPVEPADKARKMENIAFMNDALRTGNLKAKTNSKFAQDSYLVEIDKDKSTPDKIKVSDKYHSDIIDAVLYAFKLSPAYTYIKPVPKPIYGSRAWAKQQEEDMFQSTLDRLLEEQESIKLGFD